jgi:hypothetical protein
MTLGRRCRLACRLAVVSNIMRASHAEASAVKELWILRHGTKTMEDDCDGVIDSLLYPLSSK